MLPATSFLPAGVWCDQLVERSLVWHALLISYPPLFYPITTLPCRPTPILPLLYTTLSRSYLPLPYLHSSFCRYGGEMLPGLLPPSPIMMHPGLMDYGGMGMLGLSPYQVRLLEGKGAQLHG